MLKAVALSVALIVGAGPGAALLCRALCAQHMAAATGCHDPGHGDEGRVATSLDCIEFALTALPFLLEEARDAPAPPAVSVSTHEFISAPFERFPPLRAESGHPLRVPPLSINLRI